MNKITDQREKLKPLAEPTKGDLVPVTDKPDDYTSKNASNRSLFVDLKFIKFGTTDPLQGAAILIIILLAIFMLFSLIVGIWNTEWGLKALSIASSPLMLAIGVAVGRSPKSEDD